MKTTLVRGGDEVSVLLFVLRNRRVAKIFKAIIERKKKQKQLKLLSDFLFILNILLSKSVGLKITATGWLAYTQIILIDFPSTIDGFLLIQLISEQLIGVFMPLVILAGRCIKQIPILYFDEECRCISVIEYHNKQLMAEIKNLNSLLEDTAEKLHLPIDKVPLFPLSCHEQPLSLVEVQVKIGSGEYKSSETCTIFQ